MKAFKIVLTAVVFILSAAAGYGQNAQNVELIGAWPYGPASAVAVDAYRGLTFLGSGGGVIVLDTRNPSNPVEISRIATPGIVEEIYYYNERLYIANGRAGLTVVGVYDPADPWIIPWRSKTYPVYVKRVHVSYGDPYVIGSDGKLYWYESTEDPFMGTIETLSVYDSPGEIVDAFIDGWIGYLVEKSGILQIVDLDDFNELSSHYLPGKSGSIEIAYPYAYVTYSAAENVSESGMGLQIIDISDLRTPREKGTYYRSYGGIPTALDVSNGYAYIGSQFGRFAIIDVADPTSPFEEDRHYLWGSVRSISASGSSVYTADDKEGLNVFSVADPSALEIISDFDLPGWMYDIFVTGDYAYLIDDKYGMTILDISDPSDPAKVDFYYTVGYAESVYVLGDYAYIPMGKEGLEIVDIRVRSEPNFITYIDTPGDARKVFVSGTYAYVADGDIGGLRVIDVTIPENPIEVGSIDTLGSAGDVFVSGNYAYVADGPRGVAVINISDPEAPVQVGSYSTPGSAYAIHIAGDYAYVADWIAGLLVLDISVPEGPVFAGYAREPEDARDVYVSGNYAYVSDKMGRIWVVDVSRPSSPDEVGFYETTGDNSGIFVKNGFVYVADGMNGLSILRFKMALPGDLDNSETIDLSDAIVALKVLAGIESSGLRTDYAGSGADVNGDDRVGYPELLYILQTVSGLRFQ